MSDDENENRETVADIVAQMRNRTDTVINGRTITERLFVPQEAVENWADRIEAAWNRQEQCYLDQIRDAVNMIGHERFVAKHPPVGNAAAMREALEAARDLLLPQCNGGTAFAKACGETVNKIMDALAKPPRNCDFYDNKTDAETRFVEETGENDMAQHYWQMFANWLFYNNERKGEGDA